MSDISGDFVVSLDRQGRLAVPTKHRAAMKSDEHDKLFITRGVEICLQGYNIDDWKEYKKEIHSKSHDDPETKRWVIRNFIGRAHEVFFDKQGRITIPEELLKFAQIEDLDEVTVIGCDDHIEIWNPKLLADGRVEKEPSVVKAMNTTTTVSEDKAAQVGVEETKTP